MAEIEIFITKSDDPTTHFKLYVPSMTVDGKPQTPETWSTGCGNVDDLINLLRNDLDIATTMSDTFKWRDERFGLPGALDNTLAKIREDLRAA
jgi:hypothetical protein